MEQVVVVGAGLAGLRTVVELREQGFRGALILLGAEPHRPYDRPPLSKAVLLGETDEAALDADWDRLEVDLRLGQRATGLAAGVVHTTAGPIRFDRLVIATGSVPVLPPGRTGPDGGTGPDGALLLRTVDQAHRLRAALVPGARILVVGAGWIGAEVATAAARRGCAVTVLEAAGAPLAAALPAEVGRRTEPWYAEAGVRLRLRAPVAEAAGRSVRLAGGELLDADAVVVGLGVRPDTRWLVGSGVRLDGRGAVLVDAGLRASVRGVYAVGDCAAWPSGRFGRVLRVEHWDNALHAPATVAANLLGGSAVYDQVPYFWSEQFGRMVQYAGHHPAADQVLYRGDPDGPSWTVCWLRGGRLVALLTVDRPRDLVPGRKLIERATPVPADSLADPAVPLRSLVPAA